MASNLELCRRRGVLDLGYRRMRLAFPGIQDTDERVLGSDNIEYHLADWPGRCT
jgi:hypothetical protein